jgi:hypothetical protein
LIKLISNRYFLVIKEINKYLVDMILINSFRSGTKVEVVRDSHKLLVSPYREFEQQFAGKIILDFLSNFYSIPCNNLLCMPNLIINNYFSTFFDLFSSFFRTTSLPSNNLLIMPNLIIVNHFWTIFWTFFKLIQNESSKLAFKMSIQNEHSFPTNLSFKFSVWHHQKFMGISHYCHLGEFVVLWICWEFSMSQVRVTLRMAELDFSSKNYAILRVSRFF